MKVIDVINSDNPTISMEVFPPKQKDKYESIEKATEAAKQAKAEASRI